MVYREPEVTAGNADTNRLLPYRSGSRVDGRVQNTFCKWSARGDIPMHRDRAKCYQLFKRSDVERFLAKAGKLVTGRT